MKLYKFRSLANETDFERVKIIIETGCFWCSLFSDLNDPMEGVFLTTKRDNGIEDVYSKKCDYKICSFSGEDAFKNPIMWGYYANGFRGIAIEIEVNNNYVKQIIYVKDLINISESDNIDIDRILQTKLSLWEHEAEYRFLIQSEFNYHRIGQITAVYFGNPYGDIHNSSTIYENNKSLSDYKSFAEKIIEILHDTNIRCYYVMTKKVKNKYKVCCRT